jgi:predicted nucleic acid-binding Zn ribbon protein
MADKYIPQPLDVINTENHVRIGQKGMSLPKSFLLWLAVRRIHAHQRKIGLKIWRHTHTMVYFGEIPERDQGCAERCGLTLKQWTELRSRSDWVISTTHPVGLWVSWEHIRDHDDWDAYRYPDLDKLEGGQWSDWDVSMGRAAAWSGVNVSYDEEQLGGIALARRLGIPQSWPLMLLNKPGERVCSTHAGYIFDQIQIARVREDRAILPDLFHDADDPPHPTKRTPGHFASYWVPVGSGGHA